MIRKGLTLPLPLSDLPKKKRLRNQLPKGEPLAFNSGRSQSSEKEESEFSSSGEVTDDDWSLPYSEVPPPDNYVVIGQLSEQYTLRNFVTEFYNSQ